eukprot:TRINITY_DN9088_c0_g1_i1.p1 TRINITY_DN9088_c0_g1~~TRINITY_DN9088_c0_g1_i1.p1  ORF type:complete len:113 (+),score=16.08 TRINITY_DN9088_c0_g1_i1:60-398(+)
MNEEDCLKDQQYERLKRYQNYANHISWCSSIFCVGIIALLIVGSFCLPSSSSSSYNHPLTTNYSYCTDLGQHGALAMVIVGSVALSFQFCFVLCLCCCVTGLLALLGVVDGS